MGATSTLLVLKIRGSDGTVLWTGDFSGSRSSDRAQGNAVVTNAAGDVFVGGSLVNTGSDADFSLLKIDGATGVEQWRSEVKGPHPDQMNSIAADADGNILGAGATSFDSDGSPNNFAVAKFNAINGAILWHKTIDAAGPDAAYSVAVDSAGNAFATGVL